MNLKKTSHLIFCYIIASSCISHCAQEYSWRTKLAYPFVAAKRALCSNQALKDFFSPPQLTSIKNKTLDEAIFEYVSTEQRLRENTIRPRKMFVACSTFVASEILLILLFANLLESNFIRSTQASLITSFLSCVTASFAAHTYKAYAISRFSDTFSAIRKVSHLLYRLKIGLQSKENIVLNRQSITAAIRGQNQKYSRNVSTTHSDPRLPEARKFIQKNREAYNSSNSWDEQRQLTEVYNQKQTEFGREFFEIAENLEGLPTLKRTFSTKKCAEIIAGIEETEKYN